MLGEGEGWSLPPPPPALVPPKPLKPQSLNFMEGGFEVGSLLRAALLDFRVEGGSPKK